MPRLMLCGGRWGGAVALAWLVLACVAQPVALAPVLPLLAAMRVVARLAQVDAALAVSGSGG
jgi:hypothetical protein